MPRPSKKSPQRTSWKKNPGALGWEQRVEGGKGGRRKKEDLPSSEGRGAAPKGLREGGKSKKKKKQKKDKPRVFQRPKRGVVSPRPPKKERRAAPGKMGQGG